MATSSALCDAVREGNSPLVQKLIKSGGNSLLTSKDEKGQTALHVACTEGNLDLVKTLVKKKANINDPDKEGLTPLHCACTTIKFSVDICLLLIKESGSDIFALTNSKETIFHCLVRQIPEAEQEKSYTQLLTHLLEKSSFHFIPNASKEYPLHIASSKGNLTAVKLLLEEGAKPDQRTKNHETSLHYAATSGNIEVVKLLLENGANKYAFNDKNEIPIEISKKNGYTSIVELLADVKLPAYINSVRNMKLTSVLIFIRSEDNAMCKDKNGLTPLLHSATLPSLDICQNILRGNVDCSYADSTGNTVLHYLAYYRGKYDSALLKSILEKGGRTVINRANTAAETPLHKAAILENWEFVQFLMDNGVNTNAVNNLDELPLHYAIMSKCVDITRLLYEKSDLDKSGKNVGTPAELVESSRFSELYELFGVQQSPTTTIADPTMRRRKTLIPFMIGSSDKDNNKDSLRKEKDEKDKKGKYSNN